MSTHLLVRVSIIHDLLPHRAGCIGKTASEIAARLAREGHHVNIRTVQRTLAMMEPEFGLKRVRLADGTDRWKRSRRVTVGHCFRQDDFRAEPSEARVEDSSGGMTEHAMPDFPSDIIIKH